MNDIININPTNYVDRLKSHVAQYNADAKTALKNAQELVIAGDDDCRLAKEDWVKHRETQKIVEDDRTSLTGPINDALKQINAIYKESATDLTAARDLLNQKVQTYQQEQEQIRLKAEREAQEKARKEEERIRREKEEQERQWRLKEEARRKQAEELARKAANERNEAKRAEMEAQAEKARQEAAKAQEKADERARQAAEAFVPAPVIEKTVVKVAGAKKVVRYYARVLDAKKVPVEWAGRVIRPVDEKTLNQIASGLKTTVSPIEGVQFYSEESLG